MRPNFKKHIENPHVTPFEQAHAEITAVQGREKKRSALVNKSSSI